MQKHAAAFEELAAEIWVIAPDDPGKLAAMKEKMGLSFPVLVDADLATTRAYGVLNEDRSPDLQDYQSNPTPYPGAKVPKA